MGVHLFYRAIKWLLKTNRTARAPSTPSSPDALAIGAGLAVALRDTPNGLGSWSQTREVAPLRIVGSCTASTRWPHASTDAGLLQRATGGAQTARRSAADCSDASISRWPRRSTSPIKVVRSLGMPSKRRSSRAAPTKLFAAAFAIELNNSVGSERWPHGCALVERRVGIHELPRIAQGRELVGAPDARASVDGAERSNGLPRHR